MDNLNPQLATIEAFCKPYYKEKDISRIIEYCEKDTIAVAQIMLRYKGEDLLLENEILHK